MTATATGEDCLGDSDGAIDLVITEAFSLI